MIDVIYHINALLAHQPWRLKKEHIRVLLMTNYHVTNESVE